MQQANLLQVASRSPCLDLFVAAIAAAGVQDLLTGAAPLTIFAPIDAAFGGLFDDVLLRLVSRETCDMGRLVQLHIVHGIYRTRDMAGLGRLRTVAGETVDVDVFESMVVIGGAVIVRPDVEAANGILHSIDQLLPLPGAAWQARREAETRHPTSVYMPLTTGFHS